jgi:hypothetical protein
MFIEIRCLSAVDTQIRTGGVELRCSVYDWCMGVYAMQVIGQCRSGTVDGGEVLLRLL